MAKQIALLLDYNDNYAKTVADGVAKYSMQNSWRFITHRGVPSVTFEQLQTQPADGVIGYLSPNVVQWLDERKIPAVNVKTDFPSLPACSVLTDNLEIGRRAADYLAGKGFRRFAYTTGPIEGICGELKFEGFRDRLAALGFECLRKKVREIPDGFREDSRQSLAVLAVEDFVGRMVIETCEDNGLRVPEDVAVLGVNNSPFVCSMVRPQMSSIELGAERIGYCAAQLLDQLMKGVKPPKEPIVMAPEEIVERHSTELIEMEDRLIPDALRFIKGNIHKPIQVEEVARAVFCGRRTLEKRFREALGRSPHEEIRRARIRRACELLRETDTIIEVLAGLCGYTTRDRFNVAFRKEKGMTPSQYRQQYRFAKRS
ncbi:MAG: substrate-binding domain-containing protein [Kiritimatiellales bacterium]|nr:substrate-binding domain-containing protein [Kiritimatiellales bacterium]